MNYQAAIRGELLTLPSIEGGFGTLNIAREPPKSVFTTYKPKVGQDNQLLDMVSQSGDRVCEGILKYARGRDPMVSVSYSNNGTNGGQYRGGGAGAVSENNYLSGSGRQAYLPYRVMREGAFRPPVIPPQQLLPLSRQPRPSTSQVTNHGSDRTRQDDITKCDMNLKALRKDLLRTYVEGRASITIEHPATEPTDVQTKIKERHHIVVDTNKQDVKGTSANSFLGNQLIRLQERVKGALRTNHGGDREANSDVIPIQKELTRNIPLGSMSTNRCQQGIDLNPFVCSTQYTNMPSKVARGSIDNVGFKPTTVRQDPSRVRLKERPLQRQIASMRQTR